MSENTIGALALQLHEQGTEALCIELPTAAVGLDAAGTPGASLQDGELRFASISHRNRIVAQEVLVRLGRDVNNGVKLFEAAYELWRHEIGQDDTACGRFLSAAHDRVDVLQAAAILVSGEADVFDVLHCVEKLFAHIDTLPLPSLVALTRAQHPRTERDMAGGMFFGAVKKWLTPRPEAAQALAATLAALPEDSTSNLLASAWLAWFDSDAPAAAQAVLHAGERAESPLPSLTAWAASQMLAAGTLRESDAHALEALILRRMDSNDAGQRRAGLSAASDLLHARRAFDAVLHERMQERDPDTLGFVAMGLARHAQAHLVSHTFFQWLMPCKELSGDYKGVLGALDHALARLLAPDHARRDEALQFLTAWVRSQPSGGAHDRRFVELFHGCATRIVNDALLLRRVLTRWFLDDARTLAAAAAGLLGEIRRPDRASVPVSFDASILNTVPDVDLPFLARRLLGYVIDPDQLLSLALSLLELKDAARRTHRLVSDLLSDEIGYDYPGTTIARLRKDASTQPDARALMNGIAQELETYMQSLEALPRLKELAPPTSLCREFIKARSKQIYKAQREAEEKSIFRQITQQTYLKAGNASFQYFQGNYTEPIHMKSHSVTMELPRRETLDPVGNAYRMHVNRTVKRSGT